MPILGSIKSVFYKLGGPPPATYSPSASPNPIDEGATSTITLTTTNVPDGTTIYYGITGVSSGDFTDNTLTGSFTITSNTGSFTKTPTEDVATEGTEFASISFYSDAGRTQQVGTTQILVINDTSVAPTYSLAVDDTTLNETTNATANFTVTTTGVADGTTLYWGTNQVSGTISSADFDDATLTGTVSITSGSGSFSRTMSADATTEGTESFKISLYTDSGRTNLVATSSTITITDTSAPVSSITQNYTQSGILTTTFLPNASFVAVGDIGILFDMNLDTDDVIPTGWTEVGKWSTTGLRLNVSWKKITTLAERNTTYTGLSGTTRKVVIWYRPGTGQSFNTPTFMGSIYNEITTGNPAAYTLDLTGRNRPLGIAFAAASTGFGGTPTVSPTGPGFFQSVSGSGITGRKQIFNPANSLVNYTVDAGDGGAQNIFIAFWVEFY